MSGDIPHIAASTYGSTATAFNLSGVGTLMNEDDLTNSYLKVAARQGFFKSAVMDDPVSSERHQKLHQSPKTEKETAHMTKRLVQVFIADPNDNVPMEDSLIYSGSQKLTDATNQELFFEINIQELLTKHNEKRVKLLDKKVKERAEYLEPAKIRDLKMVVVDLAVF